MNAACTSTGRYRRDRGLGGITGRANEGEAVKRRYKLPWPPSVNASIRGGHYLSKDTRVFRELVQAEVWCAKYGEPMQGRLCCHVTAYPPNRRRRDLDNLLKATLDALQHAGAFGDDSQIDQLEIVRDGIEKPGKLLVTLSEL